MPLTVNVPPCHCEVLEIVAAARRGANPGPGGVYASVCDACSRAPALRMTSSSRTLGSAVGSSIVRRHVARPSPVEPDPAAAVAVLRCCMNYLAPRHSAAVCKASA